MASIEFIQKRIDGAELKLIKLNKKLERIKKVEAQGWNDPNPYFYSEYDLKVCLTEIKSVQKSLNEYQQKLNTEIEKSNSRNVPVIIDFLNEWKRRVYKFYDDGLVEYFNEYNAVRSIYNQISEFCYGTDDYNNLNIKYKLERKKLYNKCNGYFEDQKVVLNGRTRTEQVKVKNGEYEYLKPYSSERQIKDAKIKLNKDLEQEWNRKYDFIIERTNSIVGTITDASNLSINPKGNLDGYVIGTKGKAKIQTIGAGGYNIQCFHFRTLINEI